MQEQAGALMRELTRMARQTKNASQSHALERAAEASQQARQSMQQARARAKQGNPDAARESQQNAAQSLDRAAREVAARPARRRQSPRRSRARRVRCRERSFGKHVRTWLAPANNSPGANPARPSRRCGRRPRRWRRRRSVWVPDPSNPANRHKPMRLSDWAARRGALSISAISGWTRPPTPAKVGASYPVNYAPRSSRT